MCLMHYLSLGNADTPRGSDWSEPRFQFQIRGQTQCPPSEKGFYLWVDHCPHRRANSCCRWKPSFLLGVQTIQIPDVFSASGKQFKTHQINQNLGNHLLQTLYRTHKPKRLGGVQQSQIIIDLLLSIPCTGSKKEQPQPFCSGPRALFPAWTQIWSICGTARSAMSSDPCWGACPGSQGNTGPFSSTASLLWPSASLSTVHTAAGRPFTACPSPLLNPQQNISPCPSRRLSWLILHFQSGIISSVQQ